MSERNNQSGSIHLFLIILVALAVLGFLGFTFWLNFIQPQVKSPVTNNNPTKNVSKGNTIETAKITPPTCSGNRTADNWAMLENSYYTMPIPDGWDLKKYSPASDGSVMLVYSDYRYDNGKPDSLTYCNGTLATIETVEKKPDSPDTNFNISIQKRASTQSLDDPISDSSYKELGYEILEPLKTKGGLTVHRYYRHYDKSPGGTYSGTQIIDNTDYYYYEVYIGDGNVLRLVYCIIPDQPNNLSQLNQAVQSITPLIQ